MASNFIQLSTPSLIDARVINEPFFLWDVNTNASEEEELVWVRLSTVFNVTAGTVQMYDMRQFCLLVLYTVSAKKRPQFFLH